MSAKDKREKERLNGPEQSSQSDWLKCWCYNESSLAMTTDASADDLLCPSSKATVASPKPKNGSSEGVANRLATYVVATPFPFVMFAFCFATENRYATCGDLSRVLQYTSGSFPQIPCHVGQKQTGEFYPLFWGKGEIKTQVVKTAANGALR